MTARLPRVLFDLSVAGSVYSHEAHRTGIFRTVQKMAEGLAACTEIDLEFIAGQIPFANTAQRFLNLYNSLAFINSEPALKSTRLEYDKCQKFIFEKIAKRGRIKSLVLNPSLKLFTSPINQQSLANADIIHCDFFGFPPETNDSKRLSRLITIYDLAVGKFPDGYNEAVRKTFDYCMNSIRETDYAICISDSTRDDLLNYMPKLNGRVFVAHLAAEKNVFYQCTDPARLSDVRRAYGLGDDPFVLCLSGGDGGAQGNKNLPHLIDSFAQLIQQENLKDLKLAVVAANQQQLQSQISIRADAKTLSNQIVHIARVPDDDLAALYSACLLFAYPSKYEGFGLPALEAMQCGAPVLASNRASLPEVIGNAGILLDPTNVDDWCQSMLNVYRSQDLQRSLSKASLERSQTFSWQKCTNDVVNAYRAIMEGRL